VKIDVGKIGGYVRRAWSSVTDFAKGPFLAHPVPSGIIVVALTALMGFALGRAFGLVGHGSDTSAPSTPFTRPSPLPTTGRGLSRTPKIFLVERKWVSENKSESFFDDTIELGLASVKVGTVGDVVNFSLAAPDAAGPSFFANKTVGFFVDYGGYRVMIEEVDSISGMVYFSVRVI
jgi:hypothetical protein